MEGKTKEVVEVVYDKVAYESWCVTKKDGVCVTKLCVKDGVCESGVCESCYHMQAQTHIHTYFNP